MQNEETESSVQKKRPKRWYPLRIAAAFLAFFILAGAVFACAVIVDASGIEQKNETTLTHRLKRYKVAAQFIWYDFKEAVSRMFSHGEQSVSCPVDPSEPEPDPAPGSESGPVP